MYPSSYTKDLAAERGLMNGNDPLHRCRGLFFMINLELNRLADGFVVFGINYLTQVSTKRGKTKRLGFIHLRHRKLTSAMPILASMTKLTSRACFFSRFFHHCRCFSVGFSLDRST